MLRRLSVAVIAALMTGVMIVPAHASGAADIAEQQQAPEPGPIRGTTDSTQLAMASVEPLPGNPTLTLAADRTEVHAGNPAVRVTATLSALTPPPDQDNPAYHIAIYDENGRSHRSCTAWQNRTCEAYDIVNYLESRTYTAHLVADDGSESGLPKNPVAVSAPVTVTNVGYKIKSTLTLRAERTEVDAGNPTARVTATLSELAPDNRFGNPALHVAIYDNKGVRKRACPAWTDTICQITDTIPYLETRTYRAYLSESSDGPPQEHLAVSGPLVVRNAGMVGAPTLSLVAERTQVDANDPAARLTATLSELTPPNQFGNPAYYVAVYDESGTRRSVCSAWTDKTCPIYDVVNFKESHTYTAYLTAEDSSNRLPANYIAASSPVVVRNIGYVAPTVTLTADREIVDDSDPIVDVRVKLSRPTPQHSFGNPPYLISIYDQTGAMRLLCSGSSLDHCEGRLTVYKYDTYRAFVSEDAPPSQLPAKIIASGGPVSVINLDAYFEGGPTAEETLGGSNPSEACSQRCHADPINAATGEFFESTTDLEIPGNGVGLSWVRTYSAHRASVDGPMGYGWTHNYAMALEDGPAGQKVVRQENGSVVRFSAGSDGAYRAPKRVRATLVREDDGTFTFTRRKRQVFTFSASGRLRRMADLNGNHVDLSYDSGGRLTKVSDGRGRFLQIDWWFDDRISLVGDHTGRSLAYSYDLEGNLITVDLLGGGRKRSYSYTDDHLVTSMSETGRGTVRNAYDSQNRVTSQKDALGRTTTFAYEPGYTTITDPAGGKTVEKYGDGRLEAVTVAAGTAAATTTTYTYDVTNQITSATVGVPSGAGPTRTTAYSYDESGNRTKLVDPAGRVTTFEYNALDAVVKVADPAGAVTQLTYDPRGNLISVTDPTGARVDTAYNEDGTPSTVVAPRGNAEGGDPTAHTTELAYDEFGYPTTTTTPTGVKAGRLFDSLGRLIAATGPKGYAEGAEASAHTTTYTYNLDGTVATVTDPAGAVTKYEYDSAGRLRYTRAPLDRTTETVYDAAGQLVSITDPKGQVTRFDYDPAGRLSTTTDPLGAVSENGYDGAGRLIWVKDAQGNTTRHEYNYLGELVSTTSPSGKITTFAYFADGQLRSAADPAGGVTTYAYDAVGRLASVTDPDGRTTKTQYDAAGRVIKTTDNAGKATSTTYDPDGNVVQVSGPGGMTRAWSYDADGNQLTAVQPGGAVTATTYAHGLPHVTSLPGGGTVTRDYDALDRLIGLSYADPSAPKGKPQPAGPQGVKPRNDPPQPPAPKKDKAPKAAGAKDRPLPKGRDDLLQRPSPGPGSKPGLPPAPPAGPATTAEEAQDDVAYAYDEAGRRIAMTDGTGTTQYTWDAADQLTAVTSPAGTVEYGYDAAGNQTTITYPGARTVTRGYDPTGALETVTDWSQRTTRLAWDDDGQLASTNLPNGLVETRQYNPAGDTTAITTAKATDPVLSLQYQYTAGGLVTGQTRAHSGDSRTWDYAFDPATRLAAVTTDPDGDPAAGDYGFDDADQLTALPQITGMVYDEAGRLTAMAKGEGADAVQTALGYDARGNRTTTATTAPSAVPGGAAVTTSRHHEYDLANQLTAVTGDDLDGVSASYAYNGDGLRTSTTLTGTETGTEEYLWDTSGGLPLLLADGDHYYLYAASASPYAQIHKGTGQITYLHADLTGSTRATTDQDGHITATWDYTPYGQIAAHTGDTTTRFRYAGEYTDPHTGYLYLRARHYDPATAQFLTRDPLEDLTAAPYAYTGGNPLQHTDPTGLFWNGASEWAAGFGDTITFGGTKQIRRAINYAVWGETDDMVDNCSISYNWGRIGGVMADIPFAAHGLQTAARAAASGWRAYRAGASPWRAVRDKVGQGWAYLKGVRPGIPTVHMGKQGKHIPGHNNFRPGNSELTADPKELAKRAGSGDQMGNVRRGQPGFKERVDFKEEIGVYVSQAGERSPTTVGILHYAKDGSVHIVPARPR